MGWKGCAHDNGWREQGFELIQWTHLEASLKLFIVDGVESKRGRRHKGSEMYVARFAAAKEGSKGALATTGFDKVARHLFCAARGENGGRCRHFRVIYDGSRVSARQTSKFELFLIALFELGGL